MAEVIGDVLGILLSFFCSCRVLAALMMTICEANTSLKSINCGTL